MSLLPYIMDDFNRLRSSGILNSRFNFDDLLSPFTIPEGLITISRCPSFYRMSSITEKDRQSGISIDKDKFQVNLDVQHFAPEELHVKVSADDMITVEGSHDEKPDEHGFISRKFVRKYVIPEGHDIRKLESTLSSDGVLTITAPKIEEPQIGDRTIPIQQTGVSSKSLEEKSDANKQE